MILKALLSQLVKMDIRCHVSHSMLIHQVTAPEDTNYSVIAAESSIGCEI